jgi:WASH complex subunit strumpellin
LIRRQTANLLQFSSQLDAHLLYQAVDTFNNSLMNDIKQHYINPTEKPYPDPATNPVLYETTVLLEACGLDDPLSKIYVTSQPLEGLPVLLFLFLLAYLPKVSGFITYG